MNLKEIWCLKSVHSEQKLYLYSLMARNYLGEVGLGDVDWIDLAKDRNRWRALVNSVLNLRVP
jgi:hypothetical protein